MRCWLSVILYPSVTGPHPFSSCSQGDDITITSDIMILKQPHDMQMILQQPHPFSSCSRGDDITITTRSVIFLEYLYRSAIFLFQLISWYANDITTTTPFLFFFTTRWYYNNNIHSLAIDITIDVMICKWYYINHTLFSSCSQGDDITITTPFLLNISLTIDIMILKQPHDMQKILHQPHPFSSCSQQDDITMTTSFLLLLILLLLLLQ